jgi:3-hydroxyisobutyrate dehydrogenase-like beta-hydroxyacid dehydrogenase
MSQIAAKTYEAAPAKKVAFLGLGVMGYPMAGHLARAGHHVTVYNRSAAKAAAWTAECPGNASAPTPREAVAGVDIVYACVGNDADLRSVVLGPNGAFVGMKPGAIFVDHTTASAEIARELYAEAQKLGLHFVDAPVSGGQAGAQNGMLTVMCGGDAAAFDAVKPAAMAFSRAFTLLGASGAGQLAKMVNQICIAGLVQALSEGVAFASNAGLDPHAVIDVISKGAAQSWQMENRAHTMVDGKFDFGFAVEWMVKDLTYAVAEARSNGSQVPVTEQVLGYYGELMERGRGRLDTSSLVTRLPR